MGLIQRPENGFTGRDPETVAGRAVAPCRRVTARSAFAFPRPERLPRWQTTHPRHARRTSPEPPPTVSHHRSAEALACAQARRAPQHPNRKAEASDSPSHRKPASAEPGTRARPHPNRPSLHSARLHRMTAPLLRGVLARPRSQTTPQSRCSTSVPEPQIRGGRAPQRKPPPQTQGAGAPARGGIASARSLPHLGVRAPQHPRTARPRSSHLRGVPAPPDRKPRPGGRRASPASPLRQTGSRAHQALARPRSPCPAALNARTLQAIVHSRRPHAATPEGRSPEASLHSRHPRNAAPETRAPEAPAQARRPGPAGQEAAPTKPSRVREALATPH
jgi:hypothetical protein